MADITKTCKASGKTFVISDEDQVFYAKIDVPLPTLCPEERLRRRLAFRNERSLYKRECDLCQKDIFSFFDKDVDYTVYCHDCFWSDRWNPLDYGQDFDFSRPFFEQYDELLHKVPKAAVLQLNNENSEFNTLLAYSKNTYMSPGGYFLEDCFFARKSQYSKDCLNSNALDHCELLISSTNCNNCYNSSHLRNCRNCSDSSYLTDCSSCQDCFMCSGLRNKKFHFKNEKYSKEDYEKILVEYASKSDEEKKREFEEFDKIIPKRAQKKLNCEESSGDYLYNSKNANECFDCFKVEDSKYLFECVAVKDSMDMNSHDKDIELCYEISTGGESSYNTKFSYCPCASPNAEYLYSCIYLSDSFACDGFHSRMKNVIFNKEYSEEEYKNLKQRIIEHMKKTGEYGEFFPVSISPFAYNETIAQDFFPMTREGAVERGYKWKEKDLKQYRPATTSLAKRIGETPDSITQEILACEKCTKNYKIIPHELELYRKLGCNPSRLCPDCRYLELMSEKNGPQLWDRECDKCADKIQTSYSADRPEKVYCEQCYLKEIY